MEDSKRLQLLEKHIRKIVNETLSNALKNKAKESLRIEDYWNLSKLTDKQWKKLNVDLSLFLCGKGIGEPLRFEDGKVKVTESFEKYTLPYNEVKIKLENELFFDDWQIIEQNGCNGIKVILLLSDIGKNLDIVIAKMKTLGWFKVAISPIANYNGIPVRAVSFDPMYQETIKDTVRKWRYLFHLSPLYNKESILQKGLIPTSQNLYFDYPPRVYLLKPTTSQVEMKNFAKELSRKNSNPNNNGNYCLFQADLDFVPSDIDFYFDPRYEYGVFTEQPLPRNAIQWLFTMNVNNFR